MAGEILVGVRRWYAREMAFCVGLGSSPRRPSKYQEGINSALRVLPLPPFSAPDGCEFEAGFDRLPDRRPERLLERCFDFLLDFGMALIPCPQKIIQPNYELDNEIRCHYPARDQDDVTIL